MNLNYTSRAARLIALLFFLLAPWIAYASEFTVQDDGSSDAYTDYVLTQPNPDVNWTIGIDNSDSDKFKISKNATLGTNDRLVIETGGDTGIGESNPSAQLEVKNSAPGFLVEFRPASGSSYALFEELLSGNIVVFRMYDGGGTEDVRLDPAGDSYVINDFGVGTNNPSQKLDVNGVVNLRKVTSPGSAPPSDNGYIWYGLDPNTPFTVEGIWAWDDNHAVTRISSHKDPRDIVPNCDTSFANENIDLPFSFYHYSPITGKGVVVDMAKMVSYVENQMQSSLGAEAGRLTYAYDLPSSFTVTVEEFQQLAFDKVVDKLLEHDPWIEVELGPNGEVPAGAFESVEKMRIEKSVLTVTETKLDISQKQVVTVESTKEIEKEVGTGVYEERLKPNYKFEDGKIYRRKTVTDLQIQSISAEMEDLPQWVIDRLGEEATISKATINNLLETKIADLETPSTGNLPGSEIRKVVQANTQDIGG